MGMSKKMAHRKGVKLWAVCRVDNSRVGHNKKLCGENREGLKSLVNLDTTPNIAKQFKYAGFSLERNLGTAPNPLTWKASVSLLILIPQN